MWTIRCIYTLGQNLKNGIPAGNLGQEASACYSSSYRANRVESLCLPEPLLPLSCALKGTPQSFPAILGSANKTLACKTAFGTGQNTRIPSPNIFLHFILEEFVGEFEIGLPTVHPARKIVSGKRDAEWPHHPMWGRHRETYHVDS